MMLPKLPATTARIFELWGLAGPLGPAELAGPAGPVGPAELAGPAGPVGLVGLWALICWSHSQGVMRRCIRRRPATARR
ncbi:hypothetical protein ETD85_32050 [Nonomuraea zeae]|uniref:Uncharacterized protein n=1 Tax=Nonomuraea zeae TaxID=1642303 RepID=A0A5S4G970_9ACTN|nr:hypothetical protein ETD85_32050 [Nonomuraea zeae]